MNIFRDRDSIIGERPGQDFLKLKTISLSRMCDWKKIFWTLNNIPRQGCFFYIWMRAWTPLWSRILQEMTPIFFEHPDKLNLVMLEGDRGIHSFMAPTEEISCQISCYQAIMDQNKCYHGPKQKPSWTKTNVFYTERFTASWNQQKRLHVTSKINFLLPKPNSWEENYLLYSNTKEFSNHRELFRGWKDVPSMKLSCFSTFSM